MSAKIPRAGYLTVPDSSVSAAQVIETPCLVVRKQSWVNPAAASATAFISAGEAGPNNATKTVLKSAFDGAIGVTGVVPHARSFIVTVTHDTSIVACNGVVSGVDMYGNAITETWSVTATGTSKTYTGHKAFKRIDQITIISSGNATTNTVKLGTTDVLGLDRICATARLLAEEEDSANPTAGTIVKGVAASATADARGTYDPNSACNGALDFTVWYIVETVDAITQ